MTIPKDKIKQREALENAYSNFVEPHVMQLQLLEVDATPKPPVTVSTWGCYVTLGWLLLVFIYCFRQGKS
ncbi:MAG: hypothetical protein SAJ12_22515 [Jaaginema sp. PMC 1079.18]|nr:hypothetical protein [Jaaginema sp. PMC 1080.18]MEC4853763.1 hypothetical protein [Jaaginema sp. PMC 1079.18]MEC4868485.1 hypothetical protein [Jaaginema sp. PMC 1078.18]